MSRTAANFWLDLASFLVMLGLALTGGITHFVLPSGTGRWLTLFGWGRRDFGQIHFYLGLAVVALLALHLAWHWSWLCGLVAKRLGKDAPSRRACRMTAVGAAVIVALVLVGGVAGASALVTDRFSQADRHRGPASEVALPPGDEDCPAAAAINGRMTVAEAAAAAGLSPHTLLQALGVPDSADPQERLGRIRRRFGFSMEEVRRLACRKR